MVQASLQLETYLYTGKNRYYTYTCMPWVCLLKFSNFIREDVPVLWQDGGIPRGKCLVQLENMGRPHCCAISKTDKTVTVWDFDCIMEVSNASFEAAVRDGMDSSTCVFFTANICCTWPQEVSRTRYRS